MDDKAAIPVGDCLTPVITLVKPYKIFVGGHRVILVDTPGIGDSGTTFHHIEDWMNNSNPRYGSRTAQNVELLISFIELNPSMALFFSYLLT